MRRLPLLLALLITAPTPASAWYCGPYGCGYGYYGGYYDNGAVLGAGIGGLAIGAMIGAAASQAAQQQQVQAPVCTAPNGNRYYARVIRGRWMC